MCFFFAVLRVREARQPVSFFAKNVLISMIPPCLCYARRFKVTCIYFCDLAHSLQREQSLVYLNFLTAAQTQKEKKEKFGK